jgi:HME family heavy-metal exporter
VALLPLPPGYEAAIEGGALAQAAAAERIGALSLATFALAFLLLLSRYRSAVLALVVLVNVPLGLVGAVAAMWIAGLPLSLASVVGFVTLAGISARNGILKISHYLNLALFEGEAFGDALVRRGSLERLAPVLMTASAAGLALLPLLRAGEAAGTEILHPVAVVVFGGLVSATLLDLVLTPVLFRRFGGPALARLLAARDRRGVAEAL